MAKEEIYILDSNFNTFAVVDTFESFIWTDRYYEAGEFEIVTVADKYYLDTFRQDYYVYFARSEHLMIIEQIEIDSDAEDGNKLKVKGRSLEALLDRRVIWGWKTLNTDVQNGIKTLINENVISPSNNKRKFPNFVFKDTTDAHILETRMDTQYFGENLYDSIVDICKTLNLGFKVTVNAEKKLEFELYYSTFHNCDQDENPYVIFSVDYDNLINSNYVSSTVNYKTVALIGGEGEGSEKKYTSYELSTSGAGYQRREMYTDQSGVTSDLGEEELDSADYDQLLKSKGAKELAENIITEEFEGETMDTTFVYGVDYKLGDVVTLRNEYGKSSISRVIEYTFSKNATEDKAYPTFATVPDNIEMVYRNFDPTKKYSAGDRVEYDDKIYEALTDIEPGPFDENEWKEVKDSKPREIVELLWRTNNYDYSDTVEALLNYPFGEYDYIVFVCNNPILIDRQYVKVRWNVEQDGGDSTQIVPSDFLAIINSHTEQSSKYLHVCNGGVNYPVLHPIAGDDQIKIGNGTMSNKVLEIYGIGNHKFQEKQKTPKRIFGDGYTLRGVGNPDNITLTESMNNFDIIDFFMTCDLDYANILASSGANTVGSALYPVQLLNEIYNFNQNKQHTYEMWDFVCIDDGNRFKPLNDVRFYHTDSGNSYHGIFSAYGSKYTKCQKIFGGLERYEPETDIEIDSPFTNFDFLIIVTGQNAGGGRTFSTCCITVKELEYLWNCYKSGEGLASLSGFTVYASFDGSRCGYKVVSTIKFEYIRNTDTYRNYEFTVAEVYGVKY